MAAQYFLIEDPLCAKNVGDRSGNWRYERSVPELLRIFGCKSLLLNVFGGADLLELLRVGFGELLCDFGGNFRIKRTRNVYVPVDFDGLATGECFAQQQVVS